MWNPRGMRTFEIGPEGITPDLAEYISKLIPGVRAYKNRIMCAPDALEIVAELAKIPIETLPSTAPDPIPENPEFISLKEKLRPLQAMNCHHMAERDFAYCCEPMRTGKCLMAIGATILTCTRRTLVSTINTAKLGWMDEIQRWRPQAQVFVLQGRSGEDIRTPCSKCKKCRQRGWRWADFQEIIDSPLCYVITNYDILMSQHEFDAAGGEHSINKLPGWHHLLSSQGLFGAAVLDELHKIRGWKPSEEKNNRRELLRKVLKPVPQVWGLSGSEIYGKIADLWPALDLLSDGLFGSPFAFHARYCAGGKTGYNGSWQYNGRSNMEELNKRLAHIRSKHALAEHNLNMPEIVRQRVTIENTESSKSIRAKLLKAGRNLADALAATLKAKMPTLVENVLGEALEGEGNRVVVWTTLRESVEEIQAALAAEAKKRAWSARASATGLRIWAIHGQQSAERRQAAAKAFRDHNQAGIFIATMFSFEAGTSLLGAKSSHFAQLPDSPAPLQQAEFRKQAPGLRGLTSLFYILEDSVDVDAADALLPKLEVIAKVGKEVAAAEIAPAVAGVEKETRAEIAARLTAHADRYAQEDAELFGIVS